MSISLKSLKRKTVLSPPTVLFYAEGGIGKTTWAAGDARLGLTGAPNPIFLFTEPSRGGLKLTAFPFDDSENPREVAQSHEEMLYAIGELYKQDHDFNTLVIDTIDQWEPLLHRYTCKKYGQSDINPEKGDFAFQNGYRAAVDVAREMFAGLAALRDEKGMAIVLLCHPQLKEIKDPQSTPYHQHQPMLQRHLADFVLWWVDHVLFGDFKKSVVMERTGFGKQHGRGISAGKRVIYTQKRPAFIAKNRWSLPFEIELTWDAFIAGMGTGMGDEAVEETPPGANPEEPKT